VAKAAISCHLHLVPSPDAQGFTYAYMYAYLQMLKAAQIVETLDAADAKPYYAQVRHSRSYTAPP